MKRLPTRLVLLGSPVSGSLSPTIQRAALEAAGIPLPYEALDVTPARLASVIDEIRSTNLAGNVTSPHKTAFHAACDALTPIAARVGAVNTFWLDGDRLIGDNTDVEGFDRSARNLIGSENDELEVVLLGAGGAAAAVLAALERWHGTRVAIVNRNRERAALLAGRFADVARVETDARRAIERASLIINATPVGQYDEELPLDVSTIPPGAAVIDLVYRRGETAWIRAVREKANPAQDGLLMLLEQGALSFERWFGKAADMEAMRRALL